MTANQPTGTLMPVIRGGAQVTGLHTGRFNAGRFNAGRFNAGRFNAGQSAPVRPA